MKNNLTLITNDTMECMLCGERSECDICPTCEELITLKAISLEDIIHKDLLEAYSI